MRRIGISFSNTQLQTLNREADEENCTVGDIVRHLVNELTFRRHPARKIDVMMVEKLKNAIREEK